MNAGLWSRPERGGEQRRFGFGMGARGRSEGWAAPPRPVNNQGTSRLSPGSSPGSSSPPVSALATASLYKLAGQWEGFLFKERRWKTYERYGRALSRFLEAFPGRRDVNSFVRPEIIDWVNARLAEGASIATVRTELAAIRSFFQFAVDMQVAMINPAKGIKAEAKRESAAKDDTVKVNKA